MNKKIIWIIIVLAVIIGIIFSVAKKPQTDSFKIGVAAGLTGYAANWGEGEIKAYEFAYDEVKDKLPFKIEFVVENTESEGVGTVNAIKKLIDVDKVSAILGPTWGDSFQGGFPLAERAKVAVVMPSGALEALENKSDFSYLFSTWPPQDDEAQALIAHMKKAGLKKISVVHDEDAFNTKFGLIFADMAKAQGLAVTDLSMPIGTTDFRTHLAKIKAEDSDAILILMSDTSAIGPFMKQMKELGVVRKVYSTTSSQNEDHLTKFPGQFDGLFYSFPGYVDDVKYEELHMRLVEKYGSNAAEGPSFVNAYNAAKILLEAIKQGARTGEEIRDKLYTISTPGVGIPQVSFDKNGQVGDVPFFIKNIQGNKFLEIKYNL